MTDLQYDLQYDQSYLEWPFFEEHHRQLATQLEQWCCDELDNSIDHSDVDNACAEILKRLASGGWLRYAVPKA